MDSETLLILDSRNCQHISKPLQIWRNSTAASRPGEPPSEEARDFGLLSVDAAGTGRFCPVVPTAKTDSAALHIGKPIWKSWRCLNICCCFQILNYSSGTGDIRTSIWYQQLNKTLNTFQYPSTCHSTNPPRSSLLGSF